MQALWAACHYEEESISRTLNAAVAAITPRQRCNAQDGWRTLALRYANLEPIFSLVHRRLFQRRADAQLWDVCFKEIIKCGFEPEFAAFHTHRALHTAPLHASHIVRNKVSDSRSFIPSQITETILCIAQIWHWRHSCIMLHCRSDLPYDNRQYLQITPYSSQFTSNFV